MAAAAGGGGRATAEHPAAGMRNFRLQLLCMRMRCRAVEARAACGSCTPTLSRLDGAPFASACIHMS